MAYRKKILIVAHGVLLWLMGWLPLPLPADSASEESMKAAFVYNFGKFTTWPAKAGNGIEAGIRICALNFYPLGVQFQNLNGRKLKNRVVNLVLNVDRNDLENCHILFLSKADKTVTAAILQNLAGKPVLTVSDMQGFVDAGGMIGLKVEENRMRFEVNLSAARASDLKLSSTMVEMASKVLQ